MKGKLKEIVLETEKCKLIPLKETDYDEVIELFSCPEVRRHLGGPIETRHFEKKFDGMLCAKEEWHFTMRRKDTQAFVGLVSLNDHQDGIGTEISYQLVKDQWGNGIATEAVFSVMDFVFETLKKSELVAETQTANERSCRLLERSGMCHINSVERYGEEQSIYYLDEFLFRLHKSRKAPR